jgi:hypothetical protein
MTTEELTKRLQGEYMELAHAMQTGVAMEMNYNPRPTEPKHLRVGVNSAMVENAALVRLLIEKGIITESEWMRALRDSMKTEVESYEDRLSVAMSAKVKLA